MSEEPKRLKPTKDTVQLLFGKCGNQCAFPGCERPIINANGKYVGQICHISDAMRGCRFEDHKTNEERRAENNLVLMCYEHHVETNDKDQFPITRMQQIKADHESKFIKLDGLLDEIAEQALDITKLREAAHPKTLRAFYDALEWRYDGEDVSATKQVLANLVDIVRGLPPQARGIIARIVERGSKTYGADWGCDLSMSHAELSGVVRLSDPEIVSQVRILERYKLGLGFHDQDENESMVGLSPFGPAPWDVWSDLQRYCKAEKIAPDELFVGLRFDLLD